MGMIQGKVKVTAAEFRRLSKLHARAGKKSGVCWHDVLIREKGKRREYRCAVCGEVREVR